jgi:hypothetical protein
MASEPMANAQQSTDPRVADLVRSGRVRVALFLPQYSMDPETGELRGGPVFRDIAHTLADRIGVEVRLTGYQNPRPSVSLANWRLGVVFVAVGPADIGDNNADLLFGNY